MRFDRTADEHDVSFTLRIGCDTQQPMPFVAAAAAAGVRTILDGWTDDVAVTLVEPANDN